MASRTRYTSQHLPLWGLLSVSAALVFWVSRTHVDRAHYTGDDISSQHTRTAARNFSTNGLLRQRLTPVTVVEIDLGDSARPPPTGLLYTHYPSGSEIFYGVLHRLGLRHERGQRAMAILISFFGIWWWLRAFRALWPEATWSEESASTSWAALGGLSTLLLSPVFVFFADALHQFPWFFLWFGIVLFRLVTRGEAVLDAPRPLLLRETAGLFAVGLGASWFSLDLLPALAALGGTYLLVGGRARLRRAALLASGLPLGMGVGFGLHVLRNAWALGGLDAAAADLGHAFLLRSSLLLEEREIFRYSFEKHVAKNIVGLLWFYTLPILLLSLLGWWRACTGVRARFFRALGAASLGSGVLWQVLMPQHAMIHSFTYRHGMVFVVVGFGAFCAQATTTVRRALAVLALGGLAVHSLLGAAQVEGVSLKRSAVHLLVAESRRGEWACDQRRWLFHSKETPGARRIVEELLPSTCPATSGGLGLRERLAQLVLYLR